MKTIAFFNNKGGVGKTTLVYHLASMFADLGVRVVAADLDPQANLTSISLPLDALAEIEEDRLPTIYDVIAPVISGDPPVAPNVYEVTERFGLLPGNLELSFVEDALSSAWAESLNDSPLVRSRGMRGSAALAKAVRDAGASYEAQLALIDVGPNLGAINRAALLGADYVVVPVAPDIFSLKGLTNVGNGLRIWRDGWKKRANSETDRGAAAWPVGNMTPLGYVVSRFTIYKGDQARHFSRWINRVPETFHRDVLNDVFPAPATVKEDNSCLAWLKDYHSLMAMVHESRKPIFHLKPSDGAIGGHQQAVRAAYEDFKELAYVVAESVGFDLFLNKPAPKPHRSFPPLPRTP
jgi:cellulose biosynthesis protein BcsQ